MVVAMYVLYPLYLHPESQVLQNCTMNFEELLVLYRLSDRFLLLLPTTTTTKFEKLFYTRGRQKIVRLCENICNLKWYSKYISQWSNKAHATIRAIYILFPPREEQIMGNLCNFVPLEL